MTEKRLLCLGFGYAARRLAAMIRGQGWAVAGTVRDAEKTRALEAADVDPVLWTESGLSGQALSVADAILISTPPGDDGCPALAAARGALLAREASPEWIGYLSTNGVYGDYGGAWIDETSQLRAASPRAKRRIAAEMQWRELGRAIGAQVVIFRLPGIYGPGRSALDTVREGRAQRIFKPGQVFSRAHVDDIAAALRASIADPGAGDLFNIADDEPAPPQDVIAFACGLLGVEPPPLIPIEKAELSEMARSFYADNKRISNRLMKEKLLARLSYPTYREGLRAILSEERSSKRIQD